MGSHNNLSDAKAERRCTAAEISRIRQWVDNNLRSGQVYTNTFAMRKKLEQIETAYRTFRSCQRYLELTDEAETNAPVRIQADDDWLEASSALEARLKLLEPRPKDITAETRSPAAPPLMAMPQIRLQPFSGEDPSEWLSFYSKFKAMVDEKPFDTAYKFDILRQSLTGEAARQIRDLELTDANYKVAVDMLVERWYNPRLLIHAHLQKIFNLRTLTASDPDRLLNMVDTVRSNLRALKTLGRDTDGYSDVIVFWILQHLDPDTKQKCDEVSEVREIPHIDSLLRSIENHAQALRMTRSSSQKPKNSGGNSSGKALAATNAQPRSSKDTDKQPDQTNRCTCCGASGHKIQQCPKFKALDVSGRREKVRALGLCYNCLGTGHRVDSCNSIMCRSCGNAHHTMLCHLRGSEVPSSLTTDVTPQTSSERGYSVHTFSTRSYNLLPTAVVLVKDVHGDWIPVRALLDSGSQFNIITERCCQLLGLKKHHSSARIHTLSGSYDSASATSCTMKSRVSNYTTQLEALVQPRITASQPSCDLTGTLKIPENIRLADPTFSTPGRIDLLLSVQVTSDINSVGCISLGSGKPTAQKTLLGWVVSGRVLNTDAGNGSCCHLAEAHDELKAEPDMERFWTLEDIGDLNESTYTSSELRCIDLFENSTVKTSESFYEVRVPFKQPLQQLGDSLTRADRCLQSLMRRLARDPDIGQQYDDFMNQYLNLGHMTEVPPADVRRIKYYIPHHCVLRPDSVTTKLRVVFNASATTTNDLSLNDIQDKGPTLQQDLFDILTRFRTHAVALGTDVKKMFRGPDP